MLNIHFDIQKNVTLLGVALALSSASFVSVSVQSVFPYIAGSLAISQSNAVWTLTFLVVHWALGILVMPHIADRIGLSKTFKTAIAILIVGSLISGATNSLFIMLTSRGLAGFGAGLLVPLSQIYFMSNSSNHHRTILLWSLAMLIPFFFGPVIAGYFAETLNYRMIFYVSTLVFALSYFMVGDRLPSTQKMFNAQFDWSGLGAIYIFLLSSTIFMSQGERNGWLSSRFILICLLVSLVSLVLFVFIEKKSKNPLIPLDLFTLQSFTVGLMSLSVLWSLYMAWSTLVPLFSATVLGYNGFYSGLILVPCGVGYIFGVVIYHNTSKYFHHTYLAFGSLLFMFLFLLTIHASPMDSVGAFLSPMFFLGLSVSFMFVPFNLLIFSDVHVENRSIASAASNFIRVYLSSVGVELLHITWQRYSSVLYASQNEVNYHALSRSELLSQFSINRLTSMSWSVNVCAAISLFVCFLVLVLLLINHLIKIPKNIN
ncbi:MFS transporter [Acidithiobacillus thiooxidans]|uniref:Major facilitator superfamily (MFS) profile domain-containing protein n=1 Tax=Acidithiobacillus thiooxidans TaxID=930 RepID=A0A1C2ISI9_ACITH|nr:MFS transporter [Acidithiobacillus thiooxidans]OCX75126.1 hypothetical protein A6M23_03475 [Acidithiobacillus thiooxidans]OCX78914.1 hypothetical protein A6P08_18830 [Acidithiobacillus thiooxidans]